MMAGRLMKIIFTTIAAFLLQVAFHGLAIAAAGDSEKGEAIYAKRCLQCHGDEGDGLGPAAERLNPPPRDFTLGLFKFVTSAFEAELPNDDDLFRMVRDGMPGTAMPGWSDLLSEQDMWNVIAYIKTFAELEGEPESQIDYGTEIKSSPESIEIGNKLFHAGDRCSECHGAEGKGDAIKKLKNDNGDRTWPRNLTKSWTFRASNAPKDIYSRISVGIPTTQMPSFADPKSKKKLTTEERWHVANYVASLAKTKKVVRAENTVIQATRIAGALPASPDDVVWDTAPPSTFMMIPQIVGKERFFKTANDTVSVRAIYNDKNISIHLEWDDRTKSIPGDAKAISIADEKLGEDAIAVQFPVKTPKGMAKPYFLMGDAANSVNLWRWSGGTIENPESVALIDASGIENQQLRGATTGLVATGSYKAGTWRVVMIRSLKTESADKDIQFEQGHFIPIGFFAWDGSNSEQGTAHSMTTWYWLLLKPAANSRPLIMGIIAALLIGGLLFWWGRSATSRDDKASS